MFVKIWRRWKIVGFTFRANVIMNFLSMLKMMLNAVGRKINFDFLPWGKSYFPGDTFVIDEFTVGV
jgi:hypothetical protein